jgi:hypothetical protein
MTITQEALVALKNFMRQLTSRLLAGLLAVSILSAYAGATPHHHHRHGHWVWRHHHHVFVRW